MTKVYQCELWRGSKWEVMPVEEAFVLGDVTIRCMKCHGPIRLHRAGPNGVPRAHAEHRRRHRGCPLGDCFDGNFRLSPTPVEF